MDVLQLVGDIHDLCQESYFSDARYAQRRRALKMLVKAELALIKVYEENVRLQNELEVLRKFLVKGTT